MALEEVARLAGTQNETKSAALQPESKHGKNY